MNLALLINSLEKISSIGPQKLDKYLTYADQPETIKIQSTYLAIKLKLRGSQCTYANTYK